jgi:hypothetical protein
MPAKSGEATKGKAVRLVVGHRDDYGSERATVKILNAITSRISSFVRFLPVGFGVFPVIVVAKEVGSCPVSTRWAQHISPSKFVRHPLTKRNQEKLDIAGKVGDVLAWDKRTWRGNKVLTFVNAPAQKKNADTPDRLIAPTGFSINKRWYGDAPRRRRRPRRTNAGGMLT